MRVRLETHLEQLAAFGFSGQILVARGDDVLLEKAYGVAISMPKRPAEASAE